MLKIDENYSDYYEVTEDYPAGAAVNASGSDSYDGTPILAAFVNNIIGAFQAMFKKAHGTLDGINGEADTVLSSQFADAVAKYTDDSVGEHAAKRGPNAHGATVIPSPGQIMTRDSFGRSQVEDAVAEKDAVNKGQLDAVSGALKEAAYKDVDETALSGSDSAKVPTSKAMVSYINNLAINLSGGNRTINEVELAASVPGVTELKDKMRFEVMFESALQGSAAITQVAININNLGGKVIKAARNNTLVNVVSHEMTAGADFDATNPHRWCDAWVTLTLRYSESEDAFIVEGNPDIMSWESENAGYKIKTNGFIEQWGFYRGTSKNLIIQFSVKFGSVPFCACTSNLGNKGYTVINFNDLTQSQLSLGTDNWVSHYYVVGY